MKNGTANISMAGSFQVSTGNQCNAAYMNVGVEQFGVAVTASVQDRPNWPTFMAFSADGSQATFVTFGGGPSASYVEENERIAQEWIEQNRQYYPIIVRISDVYAAVQAGAIPVQPVAGE